jgi:hypothetical protein
MKSTPFPFQHKLIFLPMKLAPRIAKFATTIGYERLDLKTLA